MNEPTNTEKPDARKLSRAEYRAKKTALLGELRQVDRIESSARAVERVLTKHAKQR